jgi:hypothetical protein
MRHFEKLAEYDVDAVERQLDENPGLWNVHSQRTENDVFFGTSDIWVRFRDPSELIEPKSFSELHFPVWYPAWDRLPALRPIVFDLMATVEATHLGGILITRIPPHGRIKTHHDRGGWHAEFYTRKVYVPLKANPQCVNICEDERVVMDRGEAWWFNNLVDHSVVNDGDTERQTLIVCMRAE